MSTVTFVVLLITALTGVQAPSHVRIPSPTDLPVVVSLQASRSECTFTWGYLKSLSPDEKTAAEKSLKKSKIDDWRVYFDSQGRELTVRINTRVKSKRAQTCGDVTEPVKRALQPLLSRGDAPLEFESPVFPYRPGIHLKMRSSS